MGQVVAGAILLFVGVLSSCLGWYWIVTGSWLRGLAAQVAMIWLVLIALYLCFQIDLFNALAVRAAGA